MTFATPIRIGMLLIAATLAGRLDAADQFLVIGGGYAPSGNQASLERNVLFWQRVMSEKQVPQESQSVFFADGDDPDDDLQVIDRKSIPKANQWMAEFLGSLSDLGLSYRNHRVPHVEGKTSLQNIRGWFDQEGASMEDGDRLLIYVTSHGNDSRERNEPHNTSISLWDGERLDVEEFVELLDKLSDGVQVSVVMVQCHAGGFARLIYNEGNPDRGLSKQSRCGFFATVYDRPAAGCTPDIDESTYVEYSTYFWEALAGHSRINQPIEPPDYNDDGYVSFDEAHAYTILRSDTIDLPVSTSGEFLGIESMFQDEQHPDLLPRELDYDEVLKFATASEHAILEGLSEQLELSGPDRLSDADRMTRENRSRGRSRGRYRGRRDDPAERLRRQIASHLRHRWPELANLLNPTSIELVTSRSDEFIHAVEDHPDYERYRELARAESQQLDEQEKRVKYERFVMAVENVILRENLVRLGDANAIDHFHKIVENENGSLPRN
ncbi:hypothetical protein [Allorhodopirellula solitaria]|uniref:Caspase domain protein n=1 Tax=Allorhodopirellula solitaria TaxID=2527987 RepID=A0A5C5XQG6_9BACT|nr:hypothetical protein [Allorhodopirellula solitaria]TWT65134.1 hypothetical protein CA85_34810 [Allorhodopirellula solitaria]